MRDPIANHAHARDEIIAEARALNSAIVKAERQTLQDCYRLARKLAEAKSMTQHGHWIPTLAKIGVSRTRAHMLLRLAKCNQANVVGCGSLAEALQKNCIYGSHKEEEIPDPNAKKPEPERQEIFCRACRIGGYSKGCTDCQRLREATQEYEEEQKKNPTSKPAPNGQEIFQWRQFEHDYGKLCRHIDALYRAGGKIEHGAIQRDPIYLGYDRILKELWNSFAMAYKSTLGQEPPTKLPSD